MNTEMHRALKREAGKRDNISNQLASEESMVASCNLRYKSRLPLMFDIRVFANI